jgi:hypothetical protein
VPVNLWLTHDVCQSFAFRKNVGAEPRMRSTRPALSTVLRFTLVTLILIAMVIGAL